MRIIFWCGLTGLAVAGTLLWNLGMPQVRVANRQAMASAARGDLPPFTFVTVAPGERKMPLPVSRPVHSADAESEAEDTATEEVSFTAPESIGAAADGGEPVLQRNSGGALEISSFKPISFSGVAGDCQAIGQSMLEDTGASADLLEVLAAAGPIAAARICAANGSIVITCRGGQVTVSPRRARPDDKCNRQG